jgi:hypothetical protein
MNISSPSHRYKKAAAKRFAQWRAPNPSKPVESLKRRVGYFEEQLSKTRTKLGDMQVDESDEAEVVEQESVMNV